jgi:hypothetical protein
MFFQGCVMAGVKGRSGRKPKWTDEQIEEAALDLLDWLEEDPDNHIWFKDWAIAAHLPPEYLSRWSDKNEIFRQAMEMAEMAQESRLVNGGLRNKLNARIVALVRESRHRWAGRQSLTVTQEGNQRTLADALRDRMPEDRAEARQWLQSLVDGQGTGPEVDAIKEAAKQVTDSLDMCDQAMALGSAFAGR